eukprot:7381495-Prymnesium_polylepis.1
MRAGLSRWGTVPSRVPVSINNFRKRFRVNTSRARIHKSRSCIKALASILAVDPALLLSPPPSTHTLEQILTPALGGGLGVVDPAT